MISSDSRISVRGWMPPSKSSDRLGTLTKYAWMYRYPGESSAPAKDEALLAQALALEVFEAILRKLPPDARA